jgi:predicted MFS family arabinose efflux permease
VLSAIGCGLLFSPTTLYLDEWFIRRKGLAYGVVLAGKSIAGVVLPLVTSASLEKWGFRNTIRAWAVLVFVLTTPLLWFLHPRQPVSQSSLPRRIDLSFLRLSSFWALQTGNILQSLGYFLPFAYVSSFATTLGLKPLFGTLLISLFNTASIFGSLMLGGACDVLKVTNVIMVSTIGSTLAVFLLWGLSSNLGVLVAFALVYGFFAGGYSSTWSGIMKEMSLESPGIETGFLYGLLAGGRGIGNVLSGPLSSVLLDAHKITVAPAIEKIGYGTQYGPLILFTGGTALLGGWSWAWKRVDILRTS